MKTSKVYVNPNKKKYKTNYNKPYHTPPAFFYGILFFKIWKMFLQGKVKLKRIPKNYWEYNFFWQRRQVYYTYGLVND
jgi:hypothetical protein